MPNMIFSLVNIIESCIRAESLRDLDTVTLLIILKECCNYTWKCERATVESMSELSLSVSILVTKLESGRLI